MKRIGNLYPGDKFTFVGREKVYLVVAVETDYDGWTQLDYVDEHNRYNAYGENVYRTYRKASEEVISRSW